MFLCPPSFTYLFPFFFQSFLHLFFPSIYFFLVNYINVLILLLFVPFPSLSPTTPFSILFSYFSLFISIVTLSPCFLSSSIDPFFVISNMTITDVRSALKGLEQSPGKKTRIWPVTHCFVFCFSPAWEEPEILRLHVGHKCMKT